LIQKLIDSFGQYLTMKSRRTHSKPFSFREMPIVNIKQDRSLSEMNTSKNQKIKFYLKKGDIVMTTTNVAQVNYNRMNQASQNIAQSAAQRQYYQSISRDPESPCCNHEGSRRDILFPTVLGWS